MTAVSIGTTTNYSAPEIDCTGNSTTVAGLLIADGTVMRIDALNITTCPSSALKVEGAVLKIPVGAALTGNGSAGAGMYALNGAFVDVTGEPTLTGTVGDVSLDGTTAAVTWANIAAGGNDQSDLTHFSYVRKV
jgi:hypothetical protein